MKTIYKYPVYLCGKFTIKLPKSAPILTVQMQHASPFMWALVDTRAELVDRTFYLCGTGQDLSEEVTAYGYIDTVQMNGGAFVWHLFEVLD